MEAPQLETILGGAEIPVTYTDGRTEHIRIRKIPLRDMPRLAQVFAQDMAEEAAFYAQRDPAWIGTLTDESFAAVFEEGRRLNFTLFRTWFQGKTQELELMGKQPQLTKLIQGAVAEVMGKSPQPR